MKTHAFMITCHKQPQLVARIVNCLDKENHFFFLHVDEKVDFNKFKNIIHGGGGLSLLSREYRYGTIHSARFNVT